MSTSPADAPAAGGTLLDVLRHVRELQVAQRDALIAGDLDLLDDLTDARDAAQAALGPLEGSGLAPADLAEARAVAELVVRDQVELIALATRVRDAAGKEMAGLSRGRAAVSGYRPVATSRALHLDSAR